MGRNLEVIRDVALTIMTDTSKETLHAAVCIPRAISALVCLIGNPQKPRLIVPTDYFPVQNEDQMHLIESFIADLEEELGVAHEKLSIKQTWTESPSSGSRSATIDDFMEDVSTPSVFALSVLIS